MLRLAPLLVAGIACLLLAACGSTIADLPAPAVESERQHVDLDRVAAEADAEARFAEARRAVLAIYDAISRGDLDAVWNSLSFETRALLDAAGNGDGRAALEAGVLVSDGRTFGFEVAELLVLPTLGSIVDETIGERETESTRRKELDLVGADASRRRVIVILEGDQWRLHMPRIPLDRLLPIPGSG